MIASGVGDFLYFNPVTAADESSTPPPFLEDAKAMLGKKSNGNGVEILRPLKHRPEVIVCVSGDGRKKVIADGRGFTSRELEILHGGLAPSTMPRLEYTEEEQQAITAAQERLQRASNLFDKLWDESAACRMKIEDIYRASVDAYGNVKQSDGASGNELQRLMDEVSEIQTRMNEAHKLHKTALVERNETQRRIQAAANARCRPPQFNKPARSTDERIAELEKR